MENTGLGLAAHDVRGRAHDGAEVHGIERGVAEDRDGPVVDAAASRYLKVLDKSMMIMVQQL